MGALAPQDFAVTNFQGIDSDSSPIRYRACFDIATDPELYSTTQVVVRERADVADPGSIGAPMPGSIASVAVTAGQKVKQGDLMLTIEAMKMETGLHAERDAVVKAVHVTPGGQIDAKDLLIELE